MAIAATTVTVELTELTKKMQTALMGIANLCGAVEASGRTEVSTAALYAIVTDALGLGDFE